jgi:hypothetical protein
MLLLENLKKEYVHTLKQYHVQKKAAMDNLKNPSDSSVMDTKTLDSLNMKLINLSNQIQSQINDLNKPLKDLTMAKDAQFFLLLEQYQKLLEERKSIEKSLNDYQNVDQEYNDNLLMTKQANSRFLLWFFFCLLIVAYLTKVIFFPITNIPLFRSFLLFAFLFLFIVATFYLYIPQIFFLWITVIAVFFLAWNKIIPL